MSTSPSLIYKSSQVPRQPLNDRDVDNNGNDGGGNGKDNRVNNVQHGDRDVDNNDNDGGNDDRVDNG